MCRLAGNAGDAKPGASAAARAGGHGDGQARPDGRSEGRPPAVREPGLQKHSGV